MGFGNGLPAVVNDKGCSIYYVTLPGIGFEIINPVMLAEDFSYYQGGTGRIFHAGYKEREKGYVHPPQLLFQFQRGRIDRWYRNFVRILERQGVQSISPDGWLLFSGM